MARRVAILGFDGAQMLDVIGPFEVFSGANEVLRAQAARGRPRPVGYEVSVISTGRKSIRSESGLSIAAQGTLARLRSLDTLIVAEHPGIAVERQPIYVRDGRYWTSAGVTAGIDLALAMVEEDFGSELALLIARWLVVFVRRSGGQSQFSPHLATPAAGREPIRALQSFVSEHPEAPLDLPAMASRAGMSVRNFTRVFRSEVGVTPAAYVERIRLDSARRLMESTSLGIEQIAGVAGFGTGESLRRAFARGGGLSPREYRARFGARGGASQ